MGHVDVMRGIKKQLESQSGQMIVECALMLPLVLVVGLIVLNLCRFLQITAFFDQVSNDAVIAQAISPAGKQNNLNACQSVEEALKASFAEQSYTSEVVIEVSAEPSAVGHENALFSFLPRYTRYRCRLRFKPYPRVLRLPFISLSSPFELVHTREIVVDHYKTGVVF